MKYLLSGILPFIAAILFGIHIDLVIMINHIKNMEKQIENSTVHNTTNNSNVSQCFCPARISRQG